MNKQKAIEDAIAVINFHGYEDHYSLTQISRNALAISNEFKKMLFDDIIGISVAEHEHSLLKFREYLLNIEIPEDGLI